MSFALPTYSKFNKRYINPIYTSQNIIPAEVIYYPALRANIDAVRNHYNLPRQSSYQKFRADYYHLTAPEQEDLRRDYNLDFNMESVPEVNQKNLIYPFSLDSLIQEYYSIIPPNELSFVIDKMISSHRIIPYDNYIALRFRPFTKEEYNSIVEQWNSEYSFAGIANAVSIVSNITAQYKKDYKYLMDKLESLKQENQQLKTQIQSMSQDLVKAHQHTWM
jgi:hypothetical protein